MKIDFSQAIMTPYNKPVKDGPDKNSPDMTLGRAVIGALTANRVDEQNLSGQEKFERWVLATEIKSSDKNTNFNVEQVALIKKLVGEVYGPLVVGPAYKMLENVNNEE